MQNGALLLTVRTIRWRSGYARSFAYGPPGISVQSTHFRRYSSNFPLTFVEQLSRRHLDSYHPIDPAWPDGTINPYQKGRSNLLYLKQVSYVQYCIGTTALSVRGLTPLESRSGHVIPGIGWMFLFAKAMLTTSFVAVLVERNALRPFAAAGKYGVWSSLSRRE